jgi:phage internal scaffolding protein
MKSRSKFSKIDPVIVQLGTTTRTQQHFKDECDINLILAKYKKTGVLTHVSRARERYGDFSDYSGLADKMDVMVRANQAFELLPAELRNRFGNSVPAFLQYIEDPRHLDECVALGIYDKPKADVVTPPQTPSAPDPQDPPTSKK